MRSIKVAIHGDSQIRHSIRIIWQLISSGHKVYIIELNSNPKHKNEFIKKIKTFKEGYKRNNFSISRQNFLQGANETLYIPRTLKSRIRTRFKEKFDGHERYAADCTNRRIHLHNIHGEVEDLTDKSKLTSLTGKTTLFSKLRDTHAFKVFEKNGKLYSVNFSWFPDKNTELIEKLRLLATDEFYSGMKLKNDFLMNRARKRQLTLINKYSKRKYTISEDIDDSSIHIAELMEKLNKIKSRRDRMHCIRDVAATIPPDNRIINLLLQLNIESVIVTILVFQESFEQILIASAKHLRIENYYQVFSWDNLSSKATFVIEPDNYLVWNDFQVKELHTKHFVKNTISVTGASRFESLWKNDFIGESKFLYLASSTLGDKDDLKVLIRIIRRISELSKQAKLRVDFHYREHGKDESIRKAIQKLAKEYNHENFNLNLQTRRVNLITAIMESEVVFAQNTSAIIESVMLGKVPHRFVTKSIGGRSDGIHQKYMEKLTITHKNFSDLDLLFKIGTHGQESKSQVNLPLENFIKISHEQSASLKEKNTILGLVNENF